MKKHNHEQMLGLYEQWQASGKSKTEFAISQGIRPTTFYYWTRKFEQVGSGSASGFHRISIEEPSYKNQGELMAAIQYPSGIRLELYSSFQNLNNSYVQLLKTLTE
jgi:antitoxin component YwqK of YwqJK toxin-antitoxin module